MRGTEGKGMLCWILNRLYDSLIRLDDVVHGRHCPHSELVLSRRILNTIAGTERPYAD